MSGNYYSYMSSLARTRVFIFLSVERAVKERERKGEVSVGSQNHAMKPDGDLGHLF